MPLAIRSKITVTVEVPLASKSPRDIASAMESIMRATKDFQDIAGLMPLEASEPRIVKVPATVDPQPTLDLPQADPLEIPEVLRRT